MFMGSDQSRSQVSTSARLPTSPGSASGPAATTRPQTSAPWMRGKVRPDPQPPSASEISLNPWAPPSAWVPSRTFLEYQAVRVLMSVLFMPQAPTRISTSSPEIDGTGQSS